MKSLPVIFAALLLAACNTDTPTTPSTVAASLVKAAKVGTTATMEFGEVTHDVGSPFNPPENVGHDHSDHAKDKVRPREVVISVGGTVTFEIGVFHQVTIYEAGMKFSDVEVEGTENLTAPGFIPNFLVVAPDGVIASNDNLATTLFPFSTEWTSPPFTEPGRYLVLCRVAPHFFGAQMYGYVTVK